MEVYTVLEKNKFTEIFLKICCCNAVLYYVELLISSLTYLPEVDLVIGKLPFYQPTVVLYGVLVYKHIH